MKKEEFIERFHPNTERVFKNKEQNRELKARLDTAMNDRTFTEKEREGVRRLKHEAEKMGVFDKKLVVDQKEGRKVAKELEKSFKQAFAEGTLKQPTREEVRRAMGK